MLILLLLYITFEQKLPNNLISNKLGTCYFLLSLFYTRHTVLPSYKRFRRVVIETKTHKYKFVWKTTFTKPLLFSLVKLYLKKNFISLKNSLIYNFKFAFDDSLHLACTWSKLCYEKCLLPIDRAQIYTDGLFHNWLFKNVISIGICM